MSLVIQNIDPPPPLHRPASVYPLPLLQGEDTLAGGRKGWGVNILEEARHSSVLYICKYFVGLLDSTNMGAKMCFCFLSRTFQEISVRDL
jgi:hypothetical protein